MVGACLGGVDDEQRDDDDALLEYADRWIPRYYDLVLVHDPLPDGPTLADFLAPSSLTKMVAASPAPPRACTHAFTVDCFGNPEESRQEHRGQKGGEGRRPVPGDA